MFSIPKRTKEFFYDAEELEEGWHFASSILLYSHYLEQLLLIAYLSSIEVKDPNQTQKEISKLNSIKDSGNLTFGTILSRVNPTLRLNSETQSRIARVKKIRDTIGAHFFFTLPIDRTNRTKRAFYDVNNHRRLVRRLYRLLQEHNRVDNKKFIIPQIEKFLNFGSPLSRLRNIEEESYVHETEILRQLCLITKENVMKVAYELNQYPHGPLFRYISSK